MHTLPTANDETFETDVLGAKDPVLVSFSAPWCPQCKAIAPALLDIASGTLVRVVSVNIDESPKLAARLRVASIPMMILYKDGLPLKKMLGAQPQSEIERKLREALYGQSVS
jgi:thioredoxin 1